MTLTLIALTSVILAAVLAHVCGQRLSSAQVAALTEAAYYSALRPSWPQIYANDQAYAILPEDALRLGLRDGSEMQLKELAVLLIGLKEEN